MLIFSIYLILKLIAVLFISSIGFAQNKIEVSQDKHTPLHYNGLDKSDLYKLVEKKLAEKGVTISTTVFGHPTFGTINPLKQYYYKELNEIPLAKVKDIQIIGSSVMIHLL